MNSDVTSEEVQSEVRKHAKNVDENKVRETVADAGRFRLLFKTVQVLSKYWNEVHVMLCLLSDVVSGKYKKCPWRIIVAIVGTLLYVINPFDLVPDFLPIIGWSDDCLALAGLIAFAKMDMEEYKKWQKETQAVPAIEM